MFCYNIFIFIYTVYIYIFIHYRFKPIKLIFYIQKTVKSYEAFLVVLLCEKIVISKTFQGQNKFQSNLKISRTAYHPDNLYIKQTGSQKHLSFILDTQLKFEKHLKTVFNKVTKTKGLIVQLRDSLPRPSLLAFY